MNRFFLRATALALLALGAGCSNGQMVRNPAIDVLLEYSGIADTATETTAAGAGTQPPLIVGYKDIRVAIPFDIQRGPSRQYTAPDGAQLSLNNGFVTRAVGLEVNLEGVFLPADSAYFSDFVAAARRGERTERIHEYFDKGRVRRDSYRCVLTTSQNESGGEVIDEFCKRFFDDYLFTNRYWVDEAGRVECSLQWIHPDGDHLQLFATEQQAVSLDLRRQGC